MSAIKDVLALPSPEVDLSSTEPGSTVSVKRCGRPVFIRHQTEDDVKLAAWMWHCFASLTKIQLERNPDRLVVVGVCGHLGCIPLPNGDLVVGFVSIISHIMVSLVGLQRPSSVFPGGASVYFLG